MDLQETISQLIAEHGIDAVISTVRFTPDGDPPTCPTGEIWDNILQKCVANDG
jgi:hypothetical protein